MILRFFVGFGLGTWCLVVCDACFGFWGYLGTSGLGAVWCCGFVV